MLAYSYTQTLTFQYCFLQKPVIKLLDGIFTVMKLTSICSYYHPNLVINFTGFFHLIYNHLIPLGKPNVKKFTDIKKLFLAPFKVLPFSVFLKSTSSSVCFLILFLILFFFKFLNCFFSRINLSMLDGLHYFII